MKAKRSKRGSRVQAYALVPSRSRKGLKHNVVYIRSKSFRGFLCDCENFLFEQRAKNRHCDHIKTVRGRFGDRLERVK